MFDMKYITVESFPATEIVIFPNFVEHSTFADRHGYKRDLIIGAGFVSFGTAPKCYGKSVTLRIDSHPDDTDLLLEYMNVK